MSKLENKNICRVCLFIRYFLFAVLFLILVLLTFSDQLYLLSFITPWNVAISIFIFGIVSFLIKLFIFLKNKSNDS